MTARRMAFAVRAAAFRSAPAIPFTPSDLGAALKAWWDADSHGTGNMTDDGAGLISAWKDKIGALSCTGTTTQRPTWGAASFNSAYAGLTFNGTSNMLTSAAFATLPVGATAGNIIILCSTALGSGASRIFGYGPDSGNCRVVGESYTPFWNLLVSNEVVSLIDSNSIFNGNHFVIGEWAGTTEKGWIDGSPTNPASAAIAALNTLTTPNCRIGARTSTASLFHLGVIRHIFVTTLLTTLQRQQMEGWLAWQHGMVSLLPAGHPYKSAAP